MGSLAYRSSKLGFKSSKLAYRTPWVPMTKSLAQYKAGQAGCSYNWDRVDQNWPYMADYNNANMIDIALTNYDNASWGSGEATARMQAAHSHGMYIYGGSVIPQNFFLYQEGYAYYSRPTGSPTITEATLWLANAGEIFHTIHNEGTTLWIDRYDGVFTPAGWMAYLNNAWLEIVISASSTVYQTIILTRGDLATLNAGQGNVKTAAGLGMYSYMYSGSVPIVLSAAVIAMINNYVGVGVDIYWNWNDAVLGPACSNCLITPSYAGCASPWAVRTSLARLGNLEVR